MKLKSRIKIFAILTSVFLNVGCDQVSKEIARNNILPNEKIEVLRDNLVFMNVENTGVAYSLGSGFNPVIKLIAFQILPAIVLLILLGATLIKSKYSKEAIIGFSFVIGGGMGNIYDRIRHRSVTDFLYIDLGFFNTQIFNMADVSVVIGSLIIINDILITKWNIFRSTIH